MAGVEVRAAGLHTLKNFLPACFLVLFPAACLPQSQGKFTQRGCEAGNPQLEGLSQWAGMAAAGEGKAVPQGPGFQGAAVSCEFRGRREG